MNHAFYVHFSERILWCGSKKNWTLLWASRINRKPKTKDFNSSFWFRFGLESLLKFSRNLEIFPSQFWRFLTLFWVRRPFVVCVKTDLHENGLEENIRMLNLDETFQNFILDRGDAIWSILRFCDVLECLLKNRKSLIFEKKKM